MTDQGLTRANHETGENEKENVTTPIYQSSMTPSHFHKITSKKVQSAHSTSLAAITPIPTKLSPTSANQNRAAGSRRLPAGHVIPTITFSEEVISPPRTRSSSLTRRSPTKSAARHRSRLGSYQGNESTAKKSFKSLQRLRRSNQILERVLADQREKEQQLESNLRLLESTLKRSKDTQLRETVRTLNSSLFLLLVGALLWGNWIMFSPHLDAMIMACLVSAVLRDSQLVVMGKLEAMQERLMDTRLIKVIAMMGSMALTCATIWWLTNSVVSVALWTGFVFAVVIVLQHSSARILSATLLTLVVTFGLCAPLFAVLKSCAEEMEFAAKFLFNLMDNKDNMLAFVDKLNKINFVRWVMEQTQLGRDYIIPEDLSEVVKSAAGLFSANSALGLVTNASNLLWAFGTFMATLFSLLQLDLERLYETHLARFSPLPSADNVELYKTVRTSTWQVFAGSACTGAMHGVMTYAALYLVGSPLRVLPAFASSCLAVAPFFGSWLPLVPFVMGFLVLDRELEAIFLASMQILAIAILSPWLTNHFPASAKFIGGLPIVAGLFAWGLCGIVYGPLIVGLSIVTANIYLRYTHALKPTCEDEDDMEYLDDTQMDESGLFSSPRHLFDSSFLSGLN